MHIGVLGAGRMGGTLARLLGAHGHAVVVAAARSASELAPAVADWPGVTAVDRRDLADAEVVFLAFPWRVATDALAGLDLGGRVVVDVTNPFSADYEPIATGANGSTGRIAELLPGARIVKALNTLPDEQLAAAAAGAATTPGPLRPGVPIATDDDDARDQVTSIVAELGCTAVPIGGLDAGRRWMEPATPLFMVPLTAPELEARIAQLVG